MSTLNIEQLESEIHAIILEAEIAAYDAAKTFFNNVLGGQDKYACGFAWVNLYEFNGQRLTGNTKIGRMLKKAGISQNYNRTFELWNPSRFPCQNVDTLEHGAKAAAAVFSKYGFKAYAGSRLD
ncbi:hypothetical protein EOM81_12105 [bacterium]|nr:hypothetical protein [bacterium]